MGVGGLWVSSKRLHLNKESWKEEKRLPDDIIVLEIQDISSMNVNIDTEYHGEDKQTEKNTSSNADDITNINEHFPIVCNKI